MQDITVISLQSTRVQAPLSPSIKCNVLRESRCEDSQNIPYAALKKKGRGLSQYGISLRIIPNILPVKLIRIQSQLLVSNP